MAEEIRYSTAIAGVDWSRVKSDLAEDDFDNLRTPAELKRSFGNSHAVVIAWASGRVVGTARLLADGVCNAYLIDVWTQSSHRRRGVGTTMVKMLLETVPGHHVGLFTEECEPFYRNLGFDREQGGMSRVVGRWLERHEPSPLARGPS
jgi:GNAT superfamily N-acetyltransferase